MKKFGDTVKIKHGELDIFPNAKAPACNFFQNNGQQAFWHNYRFMLLNISWSTAQTGWDTVQCPVQTKQKMQNITAFAAMVEWPTVGVFWLE